MVSPWINDDLQAVTLHAVGTFDICVRIDGHLHALRSDSDVVDILAAAAHEA